MSVIIKQQWTDERLSWPVEDFENITEFIVEKRMIWTPELALINALVLCTHLRTGTQQCVSKMYSFKNWVSSNGF